MITSHVMQMFMLLAQNIKMAADSSLSSVTRRKIGEILEEHYPSGDEHIQFFFFHVEVHGSNLDGDYFETISLSELFGNQFESSYILENFGSVKTEDVFKITYFVKYRVRDILLDSRTVEKEELGDIHLFIRDRFKNEKNHGDVTFVRVLMTRCCNYYNGGVN